MVLWVFHSSGREDSVENNENTVDSTIIKLLKGVNREDLKEKLVEGFTVEKSGDIIDNQIGVWLSRQTTKDGGL